MENRKNDLCKISTELSGISAQLLLLYNAIEEGENMSQLTRESKMNLIFAITEHLDRIVEDLDAIEAMPAEKP